MNSPHEDEAWIARARALLDRSAEALDATSASRLNRARHAALAQRAPRRPRIGAAVLAAAAALALCVGLVWNGLDRPQGHAPESTALQAADIDVLTAEDDALDLYENLDFYAWLDEQGGDSNG